MIVDMRTYTLVPGRLGQFLDRYRDTGYRVHVGHVGKPLGYFMSDIGDLNQVVHLWGFKDLADRQRRRDALEADPLWAQYRAQTWKSGDVVAQENRILRPVELPLI